MKTRWTRLLPAVPVAAIVGVAAYDLAQKKHALLRNFPVAGHLRYLLESIGPELRQYIISGTDVERPFSRNQRRWVYASSKLENNYFGFGSDSDMEYRQGYPVVKHRTFAKIAPHAGVHSDENAVLPCAKILGGPRKRAKAFRPNSVVNISGMSFGALSGAAIEALNLDILNGQESATPLRAIYGYRFAWEKPFQSNQHDIDYLMAQANQDLFAEGGPAVN
jgi:glutamate synthase domain-containing protein 2